MANLIEPTDRGLYCAAGGFHIDPWLPVERAVITHGHSDHARVGSDRYLTAAAGVPVLRHRLGAGAAIDGIPFGESRTIGDVSVSLHPAGHLLGSGQVRVEHRGEVWVVTGDYKRQPDSTCEPFEPLRCHTLVTECTFGLPIYRWPDAADVFVDLNAWWRRNREAGRTTLVFAYALGKAQRVLAGLDPTVGPILLHGAVHRVTQVYRQWGVDLPPAAYADAGSSREHRGAALVIAPPSAHRSRWVRRFYPFSAAMVSGWMTVRGMRRRRNVDRGFVLSDHVDWPALLQTIEDSGAERVALTHGYREVMVRYLRQQGREAWPIPTRFVATEEDAAAADTAENEESHEEREE